VVTEGPVFLFPVFFPPSQRSLLPLWSCVVASPTPGAPHREDHPASPAPSPLSWSGTLSISTFLGGWIFASNSRHPIREFLSYLFFRPFRDSLIATSVGQRHRRLLLHPSLTGFFSSLYAIFFERFKNFFGSQEPLSLIYLFFFLARRLQLHFRQPPSLLLLSSYVTTRNC